MGVAEKDEEGFSAEIGVGDRLARGVDQLEGPADQRLAPSVGPQSPHHGDAGDDETGGNDRKRLWRKAERGLRLSCLA